MTMIINPYIFGSSTTPLVEPTVTASMRLWLKSNVGVTTVGTVTPLVSNWADQSGKSNNAFQNSASYRAVYNYIDPALNNLPALDFQAGGDDSMQVVASTSLNFSANGFTIFVAANITSWFSSYATLLQHSNGSTWTQGWGIMAVPGSKLRFFVNNWNNTANYVELPISPTNRMTLFKFQWDKAQGRLIASYDQSPGGSDNSILKVTTISSYVSPSEALEIMRGGFGAVTYDTSGKLGDILIYEGVTSSATDTSVETYLKQKYNIV